MPQNLTDDKSTLVQVMAWCRQATSHYPNQCWPRSPMPYGVTRPQWVNSLRPSDAYMHRQPRTSLVQTMICCLFSAKPLSEPVLEYCLVDPWEQTSVKFYSKLKIFIQENAFENVVCEVAAILSQPQCVKQNKIIIFFTKRKRDPTPLCTQGS